MQIRLLIACLLLVLLQVASARRRMQSRTPMPHPEGPCDMVQPFDQDFMYSYTYEAITEHRDKAAGRGTNIKMSCDITITVPRRCSGKLRINGCTVSEAAVTEMNEISYRVLPTSASFERDMRVSEMAFHFNGGQITRIYVDKNERTNITNFKRGILSSLQAYYPDLPTDFNVGDAYKIPQVNVYGQGIVEQKILEKSAGFPTKVEIVRDTAKINLPWERRQWNFIRMRKNRVNPIMTAVANYLTVLNEKTWEKAKQRCVYTLARGRQVAAAACEEYHPLQMTHPYLNSLDVADETIGTWIRQKITMSNSRRMTSQDRSRWDVARFDEDNIMFEEEWEETNAVYTDGFDAPMAFVYLVRNPINERSPSLVSKLSRWMAISSQDAIEGVWQRCETECTAEEKTNGRILWAELLNTCISNDWCQIPYCATENATTCENALYTFIRSTTDENPEVKDECFASLESIQAPSVKIVDATLRICRSEEESTPSCVRTLGAVTRNYLQTCEEDCEGKKPVENAKSFLIRRLKNSCAATNKEAEEVMIAAAECIGYLGNLGRYAKDEILNCAINPQAPITVAIKALAAYENITETNLPTAELQKLVAAFKNTDMGFIRRVTCFHVMMSKNIPTSVLENVLSTAMRENEDIHLQNHIKEDLRIQLMLRGTEFCTMHPRVARGCLNYIIRNGWDIGIPVEELKKEPVEKKFEFSRNVFVPFLNTTNECSVKFTAVYQSKDAVLPEMAKMNVYAEIKGRNVSIIETAIDIAGMKPIIDRVLGHNEFYNEVFGKLLDTPLYELHGYAEQYSKLKALRMEGQYSRLTNIFEPRSPFYLKLLGYNIGFDYIMSMESIRQLTIGNMWKILDAMEEGLEHEIYFANQPFVAQHAAPTCLGSPIVSTVEIAYIVKNKLNLRANLQKMLFSPNEAATVDLSPSFYITASASRTVLARFTAQCGTEMQLRTGHGSSIKCEANTSPIGLDVVCKPMPGRSQIFYLHGKRSLVGDTRAEPEATTCQEYRLRDVCALRACYQPPSVSGFVYELYLENEVDTQYRTSYSWESIPKSSSYAKELKVKFAIDGATGTSKLIWSSVVAFLPEKNEVRCNVDGAWLKWQAAANMRFLRKPGTQIINGYFASLNATGLNDFEIMYNNTFGIYPLSDTKFVISGGCEWKIRQETGGYLLAGSYEETREGTNTTRTTETRIVNKSSVEVPLFDGKMVVRKVGETAERMGGYESRVTMSGPAMMYYENVDMMMVTYKNDRLYDKAMYVTGHFKDPAFNPHFYVHRMKGSWMLDGAYTADYYCVTNWAHTAHSVVCDQKNNLHVTSKFNFPEKSISYAEIKNGENPLFYNLQIYTRPVASNVELEWKRTTEEEELRYVAGVSYRLWHPILRKYYDERGSVKYSVYPECSYCHSFSVDHPKVKLISNHRSNYRNSPNNRVWLDENWVKLHYSLLDYITLYPRITYYIINHLKNEYFTVGYRTYSENLDSGVTDAIINATLMENVGNCSFHYDSNANVLNSGCNVVAPILPANFNVAANFVGLDKSDILTINADMKYRSMMYEMNNTLRFGDSHRVSKWNMDAKYKLLEGEPFESLLSFELTHEKTPSTLSGRYVIKREGKEASMYEIVGSTEYTAGKRNFEIALFCPENTRRCVYLSLNKENHYLYFQRQVFEESHDYVIADATDDKLLVTIELANPFIYNVRRFNLTLLPNGFELESKICNASCKYDQDEGLSLAWKIATKWLESKVDAKVSTDGIKYDLLWNSAMMTGMRIATKMDMNFDLFAFKKSLDARVMIGSRPGSYGCVIKMADLDWMLDVSVENRIPSKSGFRYVCDVQLVPRKIIVNNLTIAVLGREMEMVGTTLGYELGPERRLQAVFIKDIMLTWNPACSADKPIVIKGSCDIRPGSFVIDIADVSRSILVTEVRFAEDTPERRVHFLITLPGTKMEYLWTWMNTAAKMMETMDVEIMLKDLVTEMMTPRLTFTRKIVVMPTPATANFPEIHVMVRMNHTLPVMMIPKEMMFTGNTAINGQTTDITTQTIVNGAKICGMTTMMTGCYRRWEVVGYSICMPTTMTTTMMTDRPFPVWAETMTIARNGNAWTVGITTNITIPFLSREPQVITAGGDIEITPCAEGVRWCLPERISLSHCHFSVPTAWLIPVLPTWIPSPRGKEFRLEQCSALATRVMNGDVINHVLTVNLRGPSLERELTVTFNADFAPNRLTCGISATNFKSNFALEWNPENGLMSFMKNVDCEWLNWNLSLKTRNYWTITSYYDNLKTKGTLSEMMPIEYNVQYDANGVAKYEYKIGQVIDLMVKNTDVGFKCTFDSKKYSWLKQSFSIYRGQASPVSTCIYECGFVQLKAKYDMSEYRFNPTLLELRFPDYEYGVKVDYLWTTAGKQCKLVLSGLTDGDITCASTPMLSRETKANFECSRIKGAIKTKLIEIPVTMIDFPFMGDYLIRDKVQFLMKCASIAYKSLSYSEEHLATEFEKTLSCIDKAACKSIAKSVKYAVYDTRKKLEKILGAKIYYIEDPQVVEYAVYKYLKSFPGAKYVLPEWNSISSMSPAKLAKNILSGRKMSFVNWDYSPYIKMNAAFQLDAGNNFRLTFNTVSKMYPWITGICEISTMVVNGTRLANITSINMGMRSVSLMAIEATNIIPIASSYYMPDKKGLVWHLNSMTSDNRYNVTMMLASGADVQYTCEFLCAAGDWWNTEMTCFKGLTRESVGKLILPALPSPKSYNYWHLDNVLRELLHVREKTSRETVINALQYYSSEVASTVYKYYQPSRAFDIAYRSAQYITASILHELAKVSRSVELYDIAEKFYNGAVALEPNFGETYTETMRYLSGINWQDESVKFVQRLLSPIWEYMQYAIEGHVALTYETKGDELWIKTSIESRRFPFCTTNSVWRITKQAWNSMTLNMTSTNKWMRIWTDVSMNGPKLLFNSVRVGLPDQEKEFFEIRFIPNGSGKETFGHEMFFTDSAGQRYGCNGGRATLTTPVLHFHCYKIEGTEIPANPPSSSLIAYWDVHIDNIPNTGRSSITGALRALVGLIRTVNACYSNPSTVDDLLMKVYHVHDEKVRERLSASIVKTCRRWVDEFRNIPEYVPVSHNEMENTAVAITKSIKSSSYESMMSSLKKEFYETRLSPINVWDFGIVSDVTSLLYSVCAPSLYYATSIATFTGISGRFNTSRCTLPRCTRGILSEIEIASTRFPVLDTKTTARIYAEPIFINVTIDDNIGTGHIEWRMRGYLPRPVKAVLSLNNKPGAIEIYFRPETATSDPPTASVYFDLDKRHRCDVRYTTMTTTSVKCYPVANVAIETEELKCDFTPFGIWSSSVNMFYTSAFNKPIAKRDVSRMIRNSCTVRDSTFVEAVSKNIADDANYIGEKYRDGIIDIVKSSMEVMNFTYTYAMDAAYEIYKWGKSLTVVGEGIDIRRYIRLCKDWIDGALAWCNSLSVSLYSFTKLYYDAGNLLNEYCYDLPTFFASAGEYSEHYGKYAHYYQDYLKYAMRNSMTPNNCIFEIITTPESDQAITFNNYFYNLPQSSRKCPYLLAEDEVDHSFTIVMMKNDLVINMPEKALIVGPDMKVFIARSGSPQRTEVTLPFLDDDIRCFVDAHMMTCKTSQITVWVRFGNNMRTSITAKVAEPHCKNTAGLMGAGGNMTEIPRWRLKNGQSATSFGSFIDSYSIDKKCTVGAIPDVPVIRPNPHCEGIFDTPEMRSTCTARHRSYLDACNMNAKTTVQSCSYARKYINVVHMEGCPAIMNPKCDVCMGEDTMTSTLKEVHLTVVMSLNRKVKTTGLEDILESVRTMANQNNWNYRVKFVTFGGRGGMFSPTCIVRDGWFSLPKTTPWRLPTVAFDGFEPTHSNLRSCIRYAYDNSERAVQGVAKIFLFVIPEDLDVSYLTPETMLAKRLEGDIVTSYLYIPRTCERRGAKGSSSFGVRKMFIENPANICRRTPTEVATAIAFENINSQVNCICTMKNPFKGIMDDTCTLTPREY